jgi:hypothetical protein
MTVPGAVAMGRRFIESLMTSTCTIRARSTGDGTTDPDTGAYTPTAGATVYAGPCRVRPAGREAATSNAGGAEVFVFDYLVSIPFAETGVTEGHRLTITDSLDPALIGVQLEVQKVDRGEHITARRLACTEVS